MPKPSIIGVSVITGLCSLICLVKKALAISMFIMGFSGLVAQLVLLRELLIVFSGNEFSIGIILANWLILEAFGSFFVGKGAERTKNKVVTLVIITIIFSLYLPAGVFLARILKNILGVSIGENIAFLPMVYSSFLILLPASIPHGALFTYNCKVYSMLFNHAYSSIGRAYVYETIGTVTGGIVWTYLFIRYLNSFQIVISLVLLNIFVCLFILLLTINWEKGISHKVFIIFSCLLLFFNLYLIFSNNLEKLHHVSIKKQWRKHNVVYYKNSIYGNICVVEREGQYIFFLDGIPQMIIPIPDFVFIEEFVHIPALAHPSPENILILSGGAGGVINEILKHPTVKLIDYAELDPLLIDVLKKFSTSLTEKELSDRKVRIKNVDGRLYLKTTKNKYDIIFVGLSDPSNLQTNRFYTMEFFLLARMKLNKNGILVVGLPGSLDYISEELRKLNLCIFNTLKEVFPFVRVFPGDGINLFLSSSSGEITKFDRAIFVSRLLERDINPEVLVPRYIEKKLHPGWQDWFLKIFKEKSGKINRDFKPLGVFYSISNWNAIFAPCFRIFFRWFEIIYIWIYPITLIIFGALFYLARVREINLVTLGIPICIVTTGFAGMMFDLVTIFAFQVIYGYVFSWIGLLVTSFMAGASTGAIILTSAIKRMENSLTFFIRTEVWLVCFSFVLPFIILVSNYYLGFPHTVPFLKMLFLLISFVGGFLVGVQFPLANKIYLDNNPDLSRTAGLIYSSDLIGGWIGGIMGSVFLLPVLGLMESCMLVVLLKLGSLIILTFQNLQVSKKSQLKGGKK